MNSDPEDEVGKKLVSPSWRPAAHQRFRLAPFNLVFFFLLSPLQAPGKYTVVADCEKAGPQELSVKSGDMVQLIKEGEEGQW